MIGFFGPSPVEVARELSRMPALIRNYNLAEQAIADAAPNVANMSPRGRAQFVKLRTAVSEERDHLAKAIDQVKGWAKLALERGKISQEEYRGVVGSGVGLLPVLIITVAVAAAIVAVAGSVAVWRIVQPMVQLHNLRMEQMRLWASLSPADRGQFERLVNTQNKGGGGAVLPAVAAGGGVSLALLILGGIVLLSLTRR